MMCSSLFFYSLLKESRTEDEIDKFFAYALYEVIFNSKSGIYVLEVLDHKKNIIYDCHNIPISGHLWC